MYEQSTQAALQYTCVYKQKFGDIFVPLFIVGNDTTKIML